MESKENKSPIAKVEDRGSFYAYDFDPPMPMGGEIQDKVIAAINTKYIIGKPWGGNMGFAAKNALAIDGKGNTASQPFLELHVPKSTPLNVVEGIFHEMNEGGLAQIQLSQERYAPRTEEIGGISQNTRHQLGLGE